LFHKVFQRHKLKLNWRDLDKEWKSYKVFWTQRFKNQQVKRGKDQGNVNRKNRKNRKDLQVLVDVDADEVENSLLQSCHKMIQDHNQMNNLSRSQECHQIHKNKFYGKKWEQDQDQTHLLKSLSQSQKENDFIFILSYFYQLIFVCFWYKSIL